MSTDGRLADKRIIVTGAASGIGRAVAIKVAARGASVAAMDVDDTGGQSLVEEISANGGNARYWHTDVTSEAEVQSSVEAATEWLGGGIDVLLHVAGVLFGAGVDIREYPVETWDSVIDINLKGSYLVAKYASRPMLRDSKGVIVMTASGAGVLGGSSSYAYGSSKGAAHGFSMVLDLHLTEHGIRVNDVLPGNVNTPLKVAAERQVAAAKGDEEGLGEMLDSLVTPEGVAEVYAFLASDEANYIRGSVRTR
ncbi:MAG: SDR family oxidoreductase [Chloroflexi bacterium]|nr:SDR family oxidoreductase [Chloroflexota bacterium]